MSEARRIADYHITLPLPVCAYTRAPRDRCFKPAADYGYCAAKDVHDYGFKLGLRVARSGMLIHYPLLLARPHDVQLTDELGADFAGSPADKGCIDVVRQALLAERHGVSLVTPPRKRMQTAFAPAVLRVCALAQADRDGRVAADRPLRGGAHSGA